MKSEQMHQLKKKLLELVPEIEEIRIGTIIESLRSGTLTVINGSFKTDCFILSDNKIYSGDELRMNKGYKILPSEITLEDILLAFWRAKLEHRAGVDCDGHLLINGNRWNQWQLGKRLSEQPEDVKIFLYTLLCTTEI